MILKDHIIAGGLTELNDKNIALRELQINDGLFIHTCNDYGKSLEVIKAASSSLRNKVKIITKVYFNYPDINHRRFRSILSQIKEQKLRLGFLPMEWDLQICCYCSTNHLISNNAQKFFHRIKNQFGINKVFLEIYPVYKYSKDKTKILNNFYKGEIIFGLTGYQNLLNRTFDEKDILKYSKNNTYINFIGILGKGIQNKIFPKKFDQEFINKNILYLLDNVNKNKLSKGITNFSSIEQYQNFRDIFINLQKKSNKNFLKNNSHNINISNEQIFFFKNLDHYGSYHSLKEYLLNPKLVLYKFKVLILKFLKHKGISNDLFG